MSKVTVITIVYNDINNLKKTISNLFSFDCNFDFILFDGLSTDGTEGYVNGLSVPCNINFNYLRMSDDGISNAWNQAVEFVNTEKLLFLNAGDIYYKGFIEKCVDLDPSFIHCFSCDVGNGKTFLANHTKLNKGMFAPHNWILFPTFLFDNYKYDEDLHVSMDYKLLLELYLNHRDLFISYNDVFGLYSLGGVSDKNFIRSFYVNLKIQNSFKLSPCFFNFFIFIVSVLKHFLSRILN